MHVRSSRLRRPALTSAEQIHTGFLSFHPSGPFRRQFGTVDCLSFMQLTQTGTVSIVCRSISFAKYCDRLCIGQPRPAGDGYDMLSFREVGRRVSNICAALQLHSPAGIVRSMAIWSSNRVEWLLADYGTLETERCHWASLTVRVSIVHFCSGLHVLGAHCGPSGGRDFRYACNEDRVAIVAMTIAEHATKLDVQSISRLLKELDVGVIFCSGLFLARVPFDSLFFFSSGELSWRKILIVAPSRGCRFLTSCRCVHRSNFAFRLIILTLRYWAERTHFDCHCFISRNSNVWYSCNLPLARFCAVTSGVSLSKFNGKNRVNPKLRCRCAKRAIRHRQPIC
jgi:hypothetical protein